MGKKVIVTSDFDGTLTTRDSMMEIIIFKHGRLGLIIALLSILPWLILMFLHLYSNQRTKERLLHHCFGDMKEADFNIFCQRFAQIHKHIIRQSLYQKLLRAKAKGAEVVVVTASPENWVRHFVPDFKVLGTKMEFSDKGFTGRFLTPNCYGEEKVNRILQAYPDLKNHRADYRITAYGDSKGDTAMLSFADEGHLL